MEDGSIGYYSSEGEAGRLAESMDDLFSLIVSCICWHDCCDAKEYADSKTLEEYGQRPVSYTHQMCIRDSYSPLLDTPQKGYLFHALGMLHYRCYPEGWIYERLGPDGMIALIFWGDYSYGTYDTRFMIERYVDLDERWLFDLAKDPEGRKPTVTWQTYNRGGVLYGSYDEMFISLLPLKVENPELKRVLWDYFRIRSQKKKVAKSITVYKDAAERFGDE